MSEILLIDEDSKEGNLYLMQLSTFHKQRGDKVLLNEWINPDKVYISCLFKKNRARALGRAKLFSKAEIEIGGTGINYSQGNLEISRLKPDYELYPDQKESIGRTTYGCIRKCGWCCVPQKEGKFKRWQHVSEFYDERFDIVRLLDNNILVDKNWFFENVNFIQEYGLKIKENGMDIRLLTPEIAKKLRELNFDGMLHFAWDQTKDEQKVLEGIQILKEVFNTRKEISICVLTNYNTTKEQDIYRCKVLRNLDVNPFVMVYEDNSKADKWYKTLARQVNRKAIFWSDTWKDNL